MKIHKIEIFNIFLQILSLFVVAALTYQGYKLQVSITNKNIAFQEKEFWNDLCKDVELDTNHYYLDIQKHASMYYANLSKVVNEFETLRMKDSDAIPIEISDWFHDADINLQQINIALMNIITDYDLLILKYSSIVNQLDIEGWDELLFVRKDLISWKENFMSYFKGEYKLFSEFMMDKDKFGSFASSVQVSKGMLRDDVFINPPPHLAVIDNIKHKNFKIIENKHIKKT